MATIEVKAVRGKSDGPKQKQFKPFKLVLSFASEQEFQDFAKQQSDEDMVQAMIEKAYR